MKQVDSLADMLAVSPKTNLEMTRCALTSVLQATPDESPPEIAERLYLTLAEITQVRDPYQSHKAACNAKAMAVEAVLRTQINESDDPFLAALELAVAGNAVDFGVQHDHDPYAAFETVVDETSASLDPGSVSEFRNFLNGCNSILYLADNAGEIIFDKLFIEQLHSKHVTVAVRGNPILNDCIPVDVENLGFESIATVISNGSGVPGTVLEKCSDQFKEHFSSADLVISKGQGNFETLATIGRPIAFLLKVKCAVVARHAKLPVGKHTILLRNTH